MTYYRIGKGGKRYWGKSGAGILFTDGEKVLLLKRAGDSADQGGKWGIPGGKTESGESAIETAKRESQEECGIAPQGVRFAQWDEKDGQHVFSVFAYKVDQIFNNVKLSDEHDDWQWVSLKEAKKLSLHPAFEKNLDHYQEVIDRKFGKKTFSEWLQTRETL